MDKFERKFDVIVIGGGHAGFEAAYTSARLGADTLLITLNVEHIAQMSCNPAIGGIAKGHVVREIDAMGGMQGEVTEASNLQFRMLNRSKGPAVWSPRSQCDKLLYQKAVKYKLENTDNLKLHQANVESFILKNSYIIGIRTEFGDEFYAKTFVLCSGTFLNGVLHYGLKNFKGGRAGDPPSLKLSESINEQLGLQLGRLKTGTPQRILSKSINFSKMYEQGSEDSEEKFTFYKEINQPTTSNKNLCCYLVNTTKETSAIAKENLNKTPLYQGKMEGTGARYCPSFEDKIIKFPHHETHTLYLEPEGEFTGEYYLNGFSTSLPTDIQWKMLRTIPGLEKAEITRYAYAIEYDFVLPHQIERTLAVKNYKNLFLAGQINGTSGYEEAAGQGLIAGLNAARFASNKEAIEIGRDKSYIGVMIDDLVTKDIKEPYRLFTSRAEYRLHLRQDCADLRLCPLAYELNLLPSKEYKKFQLYSTKLDNAIELSREKKYEGKKIKELLKYYRGKVSDEKEHYFPTEMLNLDLKNKLDRRVFRQLVIQAHYEGFLGREKQEIQRLKDMENVKIPPNFDYNLVKGLKKEARSKLIYVKPTTMSQASRIDGVTPADLTILRVYLKKYMNKN